MHLAHRTAPVRAATVLILALVMLMTTGLMAPVMFAARRHRPMPACCPTAGPPSG